MAIHPLALVGSPPEHREWCVGDPIHGPAIASSAIVGAFATVDGGWRRPTVIGERTWIMKHVHVGHDAQIGADCEIAVGTVVGGHVTIGDRVRVGTNVTIRTGVTIGDGARIGCGAVVVRDVPAGELWVGNPAYSLSNLRAHRLRRAETEEEEWQRIAARL